MQNYNPGKNVYQDAATASEWYTFNQIKDWLDYNVRIIIPTIEKEMKTRWIPYGNIFYKKPLGNTPNRTPLPF